MKLECEREKAKRRTMPMTPQWGGIDGKCATPTISARSQFARSTIIEAGAAVAELITAEPPKGQYQVHPGGVEEVVADKGYHSNEVVVGLSELEVRTYIAEPDRGARHWEGKQAEKAAVYGNRRRIRGQRGKRMQRQRGQKIERNFAHPD